MPCLYNEILRLLNIQIHVDGRIKTVLSGVSSELRVVLPILHFLEIVD